MRTGNCDPDLQRIGQQTYEERGIVGAGAWRYKNGHRDAGLIAVPTVFLLHDERRHFGLESGLPSEQTGRISPAALAV